MKVKALLSMLSLVLLAATAPVKAAMGLTKEDIVNNALAGATEEVSTAGGTWHQNLYRSEYERPACTVACDDYQGHENLHRCSSMAWMLEFRGLGCPT